MRLEHPILFGVRQARVERQNFSMRQVASAQRIGGVADFAFAAHKNQDIAVALLAQLIHRVEDRLQLIAVALIDIADHRTITHLHRISAA